MTTVDHTLPHPLIAPVERAMFVMWSSTRAKLVQNRSRVMTKLNLVLGIEFSDRNRGTIEAWIEQPASEAVGYASEVGGRLHVLKRQPARFETATDGELLHIDASIAEPAEPPIVSITMRLDRFGMQRLVYARTPLLERAGFAPGAYDPPTMRDQ